MVLDFKNKNKPSQETLYGWFPGGQEPSREDPREIYIKLGSRPPRDQSYYETNILFQYHQSLNPSQREYANKQSASEALKPPWSLHEVTTPNTADNANEIDAKNYSRAKSAPNVPTQRIVLKIPNAQLNNIFDVGESLEGKQPNSPSVTLENLNFNESYRSNDELIRPKSSFNPSYTPVSSATPDRFSQSRANNNESRLSFTEKSENKTVNESDNNKTEVSSNNQKMNDLKKKSYSNIMNDIIDSKYLENIQTDKQIESNETIKMETTDKYAKSARMSAYQRNPNLRVEVKNIGKKSFLVDSYENTVLISHNKFRPTKTTIKNSRPKTTINQNKLNTVELSSPSERFSTMKQRAGTAPIIKEGILKTPTILYNLSSNTVNKFDNHYTLSDYHRELLLNSPDKKPITGTTSQLSLSEKLNNNNNKTTNTHIETEVLHTNKNSFNDVKLVDGHWKDQLMNRGSYLQKRPKYCVKSDPEKLKIDPPLAAFDTHNSSETYFYNTLPFRKTCYTVNPHFISENLNVKKMDLQNRLLGSSAGVFGPVKYRRDYAFVY